MKLKRPKATKKVTIQEWMYLGCLAIGVAGGIVGVSFIASRPNVPNHSAASLQAPGVVSWYTLTKVSIVPRNGKPVFEFSAQVNALHGTTVKLRGYITPLAPGVKQKHFILSPKPPTCAFCMPGGPDEMVEVFTRTPVPYSLEPVTVSGTFALLQDHAGGLFYRLADAAGAQSEDRL